VIHVTIGERIKAIRTEQGLTQKQVGDLCEPKIHEVQIRKYERGEVTPKLQNAVRIALALGVPVADLYGEDWEQTDYEGRTQHYSPFMKYLGTIGYRIYGDSKPSTLGNLEIQVPTGGYVIVGPNGKETVFSKEEFKAFEEAVIKTIEFQIWNKSNQ